MKRLLVLFSAVLLLAACHNESRDPVIKGYRLQQLSGLSLGIDGVTADMTLDLEPRSVDTVQIPLNVRLLRPLALLTGDFEGFDLSQFCADVDLTIRKGGLKKRIQKERVPLSALEKLLSSPENQ